MTVKYQLKSAGVTASNKFYRKDILRDLSTDPACLRYKKRLATKREVMLLSKEINHKEKSKNQKNKKEKQITRKGNY